MMTSRILLFQLFVGCIIATWKVIRVRGLTLTFTWFVVPWFRSRREMEVGERTTKTTSSSSSSSSSSSQQFDQEGMRILLWYILVPLMFAWIARLWYTYDFSSGHLTIWNFFLESAADFSYLFGFLNMTPQLFLNYKMKSVAAMPWKVMTYKFFNTIIDDIFAFFVVQTTRKHRWMTLRDDFIFLIFLFQRWCYPVDSDRPDEYGYTYGKKKNGGDSSSLATATTTKETTSTAATTTTTNIS